MNLSASNNLNCILRCPRAIQESLLFPGTESQIGDYGAQGGIYGDSSLADDELRRVLELSKREMSLQRAQEEQEDEELQMILKLSLTEK